MNNEYIFTIDVNDRPGNKKLDQFEGRVERLNKNEVKLQIDVEGLDREKLLDYKKLAASVDPKMTIQMEYEYDKKSIDVMKKDISNLGELKLHIEKGNATAVEQYIKQTIEKLSKGIEAGINPNELIKDYKFAMDVIAQYVESKDISPVSDKTFAKLQEVAEQIQGFDKKYTGDTKSSLDTIITRRTEEYKSMISDFEDDMKRLSKMGAVEFTGEPIDGSKIKEYIKDYVRLIKLSGELKKTNLDTQISQVNDNASLKEKVEAIKGLANEARITAEEIEKINKAIASGDTSQDLKEQLGLLQNLYERQLTAYNNLLPSNQQERATFAQNYLPDDWQNWTINNKEFNVAITEAAAEFRRQIGHAFQEATANLGEDLIKSLGIDKLHFEPGIIFGDEMEEFVEKLFDASIKTGEAIEKAGKEAKEFADEFTKAEEDATKSSKKLGDQAKETGEKTKDANDKASASADEHSEKVKKQALSVEELSQKLERLKQLQNTLDRMEVAPFFGDDDTARASRVEELARQYIQTLEEINRIENSGESQEVIKQKIGLLSTLASKQMEAMNTSIPTGVDRNEYLKSAVNFDFGTDEAVNSLNKVKERAREFADDVKRDFSNIAMEMYKRFPDVDRGRLLNSARTNVSALEELVDVMERIMNASKGASQGTDDLSDSLKKNENAAEGAADAEKKEEQATQSGTDATNEKTEADKKGAQAAEEKAKAEKEAAEATRQTAEEQDKAKQEAEELARAEQEALDKTKQAIDEKTQAESEAADKSKQAAEQQIQAEQEIADATRKAAEEQEKAAQTAVETAEKKIEAEKEVTEEIKKAAEEQRQLQEQQSQTQSQTGDDQKKIDVLKEEIDLFGDLGDASKFADMSLDELITKFKELREIDEMSVMGRLSDVSDLSDGKLGKYINELDQKYGEIINTIIRLEKEEANTEGIEKRISVLKEYGRSLATYIDEISPNINGDAYEKWYKKYVGKSPSELLSYEFYDITRDVPTDDWDDVQAALRAKGIEDSRSVLPEYEYINANALKLYIGMLEDLSNTSKDATERVDGLFHVLKRTDTWNGYKNIHKEESLGLFTQDQLETLLKGTKSQDMTWNVTRGKNDISYEVMTKYGELYTGNGIVNIDDILPELLKRRKEAQAEFERQLASMEATNQQNQQQHDETGSSIEKETEKREKLSEEIKEQQQTTEGESQTSKENAQIHEESAASQQADGESRQKTTDEIKKQQQATEGETSTSKGSADQHESNAGSQQAETEQRSKATDQIGEQTAKTEADTNATNENKSAHEGLTTTQQEEADGRQKVTDGLTEQVQRTEADSDAVKGNQTEHSKTADVLKEEGSERDTNADKIKEGTAAIEADTAAADENAKAHKEMQDVKEQGGTKTTGSGETLTGADSNALNELVTALEKIVSSAADATAKKDELAAAERTLATDTGVSIVRLNAEAGALDSVRRAADEAARAKERFISSNQTLANQTRDSSDALNKEATVLREIASATQTKAVAAKLPTSNAGLIVDKEAVFSAYDSYEAKGAATYDTDRYNKITAALAADNPDYNKIAKLIETGNDAVDAAIRKREDLEGRLAKANERIKALEAKGIATFDADSYAKLQKSLDKVDTSATKQTVTALENAITQTEKDYEKTYRELYDSTLKRYEEMQQNEFYQKSDKLSGLAAKVKVSPNDGGMLNEFIQELDVVKKKIEESESLLISYRHVLEDGLNLSNIINGDSHLTEKFKPQLDQLEEQLGTMELNPELVTKAFEGLKDLSQSVDNELTQLGSSVVSIMAEIDSLTKQRSEYMKNVKLLGSADSSDDPNYKDIAASVQQYETRLKNVRDAVAGINRTWDENNESVKKANAALDDYENKIKNVSRTDITKNAQGMIDSIDRVLKQKGSSGLTKAYTEELEELKGKMQEAIRYVNNLGDQPIDPSKVRAFFSAFEEGKATVKGASDQINKLATLSQLEGLLSKINDDIAKGANRGVLGREYADLKAQVESAINEIKNCTDASKMLSKIDFPNFANLQKDLHNSAIESGALKGSMVSKMADAINNQSAQFLATYFSFQDIIRYTKEITNAVVQTDSALTELKKVSDESNERIQQSFKKSAETAQELGNTITNVINSTSDWARLNILGLTCGDAC